MTQREYRRGDEDRGERRQPSTEPSKQRASKQEFFSKRRDDDRSSRRQDEEERLGIGERAVGADPQQRARDSVSGQANELMTRYRTTAPAQIAIHLRRRRRVRVMLERSASDFEPFEPAEGDHVPNDDGQVDLENSHGREPMVSPQAGESAGRP